MSVGYRSVAYAESFAGVGEPVWISGARGWLIRRSIPGFPFFDAMGCYPIFSCENWSSLGADLAELDGQPVAVSLVTDPFGDFEVDSLRQYFPDLVKLFKQHHLVDLAGADWATLSKHHRYYVRLPKDASASSLPMTQSRTSTNGSSFTASSSADTDSGGSRPSCGWRSSVRVLVPGAVPLLAPEGVDVVGAHIWYVDGDVA